jgi:biopolymer transport protein ExbD
MAMDIQQDEGIIAGINITPMVDIMLVLLIIFMLTASVIEDQSLKVELPEAATASKTETSMLGITITSDAVWYLNGDLTDEEGLRAFIQGQQTEEVEMQAVIAADAAVSYGEVVKVIDLVKQEGVIQFALNTDPNSVVLPEASPDNEAEAQQQE